MRPPLPFEREFVDYPFGPVVTLSAVTACKVIAALLKIGLWYARLIGSLLRSQVA